THPHALRRSVRCRPSGSPEPRDASESQLNRPALSHRVSTHMRGEDSALYERGFRGCDRTLPKYGTLDGTQQLRLRAARAAGVEGPPDRMPVTWPTALA